MSEQDLNITTQLITTADGIFLQVRNTKRDVTSQMMLAVAEYLTQNPDKVLLPTRQGGNNEAHYLISAKRVPPETVDHLKLQDEALDEFTYHPTLNLLLIYAFRYALGRMTSAPSDVAAVIMSKIDVLENWEIKQMCALITEAEGRQKLGWDCDVETWQRFRAFLQDELAKRNRSEK